MFIAHFCACGFYIVASEEYSSSYESATWIIVNKLADQPWYI